MTAQLRDTLTSVAVYYGDDSCRDACSAALGALAGILELPSLVSGVQEELESEAFFRQVGAVVVGLQDVAYTEGCLGACEGLLQDGDAPTRAGGSLARHERAAATSSVRTARRSRWQADERIAWAVETRATPHEPMAV